MPIAKGTQIEYIPKSNRSQAHTPPPKILIHRRLHTQSLENKAIMIKITI